MKVKTNPILFGKFLRQAHATINSESPTNLLLYSIAQGIASPGYTRVSKLVSISLILYCFNIKSSKSAKGLNMKTWKLVSAEFIYLLQLFHYGIPNYIFLNYIDYKYIEYSKSWMQMEENLITNWRCSIWEEYVQTYSSQIEHFQ